MAVNISFRSTTATNYQTLLDDVVDFATNDQINTVAINAGGTGYSVGDIITLSDGTFLVAATFRVTAETAGAITALEVWNAGSYSVNTGATGIATTGGNADATVDVTYQTPWTLERDITNRGLVGVTIVNAGTGYTVSDTLTGVSGTGTKYTLNVDSVSSGVITGVSIVTRGNYTVDPTNPDTVSGGTGASATFTTVMSGQTTGDQREKLLKGIGSGSDEVFVGIRSYENIGANAQNWELAGMTGFDLALPYEQQPDISPGRFDAATSSIEGGSFVPLADVVITYRLSVTGRRIEMAATISTTDISMYLGFFDQTGTVAEIPYPLLVGGCVNQPDTRFSSVREGFTSIAFPVGKAQVISVITPDDIKNGPLMSRLVSGQWETFMNAFETSASTTSTQLYTLRTLTPPGQGAPNINLPPENDSWIASSTLSWEDLSKLTTAATQTDEIRVTPDSGGDLSPLFPQSLLEVGNSGNLGLGENVYGELSGIKWVHIAGTTIVSGDTITINGVVHRVYQSGNKSEPYHFWAMEER